MTENQGRFVIRILMFIVMLKMEKYGLYSNDEIVKAYAHLRTDYSNGQIF